MSPSERNPRMHQAERWWVFAFTSVVLFLTTLPYLLGYQLQGEMFRFAGFVFAVEDGNSYIAKMLSGYAGAWLFKTPYTLMPQSGVLVFIPYLLLGKLAAPPGLHEQHVALYHLFRLFSTFFLAYVTYAFISFFMEDVRLRKFGLALSMVGGGLGWFSVLMGQDMLFGSIPLDFYSPETFGFLSIYGIPHLVMARALSFQVFLEYLRLFRATDLTSRQIKLAYVRAGLSWLAAGFFQPINMAIVGFVLFIHGLGLACIERFQIKEDMRQVVTRLKKRLSFFIGCGALPGLYLMVLFLAALQDPFLQAWADQNRIRSPHPLHYLLAYGLIVPFAIIGGKKLMREDRASGSFLVLWAISLPVLAYIPINLQRRLPDGIWVSLVTLAMVALAPLKQEIPSAPFTRPRRFAMLLWFTFPSSLILLFGGMRGVFSHNEVIFRAADEVRVFEALAREAAPGSVVLSAYRTGNALPAWAPLRVVVGHGPESANLDAWNSLVRQFYQQETPLERQDFLQEYQIAYVFWGPAERSLGDFRVDEAPFLSLVASSGEYAVYRVENNGLTP